MANHFGKQIILPLTFGVTINWNVANGSTGVVTLTGAATLAMTNVAEGEEGKLIVKQDVVGSRTITLPAGSKVHGGGAGLVILSAAANAVDILYFEKVDGVLYWRVELNFN